MEHSFKRRRVSPNTGGPHGVHRYPNKGPSSKGGSELPPPVLKSRSFGNPHSPHLFSDNVGRSIKDQSPDHRKLSDLHPRNLIPTEVKGAVEAVQSPSSTVVASVIQVVVNNNDGDLITQALVPVSSKIVSVQGFAPITLGKGSATASATPSAAANPKQASNHQQPSPTLATGQDSYGPQTTAVAASGAQRPSQSQSSEGNASANSSPLSINVPGSKSQVLLSSPPSTPLPSTPASTTSSSPSTESYFSASAPTAASGPSSVQTKASATQSSNAPNVPAPSKGNSTLTTTSPTRSAASTTTGPISLNPVFSSTNANSTLVTSTRSRPSFASSASLTSTINSSRNATSLVTSTTGTPSISQTVFSSASASSTQGLSSASSTSSPTTSGAVGGFGGNTGPGNTGSAPSSTASSGAGSGGGSTVDTRAVVGGVVGGVAGLAVILLLLVFLLRWRRSKQQRRASPPVISQSAPPGVASTAPTTERSSIVPFAASAFMRRMRPGSGQTAASGETAPSERGFQNFGGRKLESVLSSRGDGYNDPVPPGGVAPRGYAGTAAGLGLAAGVARPPAAQGPSPGPSDETLSGSSFYRDSNGFYGGNEGENGLTSPQPTSPTSPMGSPPSEVVSYIRPGPARTPVINEPGVTRIQPPTGTGQGTSPPAGRGTPPPPTARGTPPPRTVTPQLRRPDAVGRSHPSFDGSRGSRFSEAV